MPYIDLPGIVWGEGGVRGQAAASAQGLSTAPASRWVGRVPTLHPGGAIGQQFNPRTSKPLLGADPHPRLPEAPFTG